MNGTRNGYSCAAATIPIRMSKAEEAGCMICGSLPFVDGERRNGL